MSIICFQPSFVFVFFNNPGKKGKKRTSHYDIITGFLTYFLLFLGLINSKSLFDWSDLRKDGKKGERIGEKINFCVVWLGGKIGGILVGLKHFLPRSTKNKSVQFGKNRIEKMASMQG